jgi:hypothetical protein
VKKRVNTAWVGPVLRKLPIRITICHAWKMAAISPRDCWGSAVNSTNAYIVRNLTILKIHVISDGGNGRVDGVLPANI